MYIKYLIKTEEGLKSFFGNKTYTIGLNIDENEYLPNVRCGNGLYFCKYPSENTWFESNTAYKVSLPEGTQVVLIGNKYKAPQLILERELTLEEYKHIERNKLYRKSVSDMSIDLYDLPREVDSNTTDKQWLSIVSADGRLLQLVPNKTQEICLAAVRNCGWALEWVEFQTPELTEEMFLTYAKVLEINQTYKSPHILERVDAMMNAYRKKPYYNK